MKAQENQWKATMMANTKNLAVWTGAWLVTMAVATFGPKLIWDFDTTFSVLSILLNVVMGVMMILANIRYIDGLDEMQRKVNNNALALALGVAVVGGLAYSMLDIANVIPFDAEISHVMFLVGITYSISIAVGTLKYK